MNRLPVGRKIIAIGVNARASYLVGIPVKRLSVLLYVVVGLAAGIAGVLQVARLDSAPPSGTLGVGFEVTVLTPCSLAVCRSTVDVAASFAWFLEYGSSPSLRTG